MSTVTTSVKGFAGGASPAGKPSLPHITDLISVSAGVDPKLPIRKLLEEAHACMRQADTFRSFGRPDVALREYTRGWLIAFEVVPHHKEYVSLVSDRGGLGRLYDALKHKAQAAAPAFEAIKEEIKADNKRTGVLPAKTQTQTNGTTQNDIRQPTASTPRTKPVVHPKPQALHGNAIKHGSSASRSSVDMKDLNARFANLGGPAKQDPRIKTHPIAPPPPPPAPRGPRPMPARESSDVGLDTSVPNLPKVPDAIYSPARGTVSTEAGQLPSSTSRGLFTRTGSSSSFTNGLPQSQPPTQGSSGSGPLPPHSRSPPPIPPSSLPPLPPGDYLTAPQLCDLMRTRSSQILLIDVRPRDEFENGHILAHATICIEPSVLLRENISATEIAESNVLAPSQEQDHFDQRDQFEVVVLYDQNSESIPSRPTTEAGTALMSLQRALRHFNYGRELQNPPKLLKGGLDAWTEFMGPQAVRSTSTTNQTLKPAAEANSGQGEPARSSWAARRPSKHVVKPLNPEEVKQWQETLAKEDMDASQSPNFVRSTEDFLRRFPPVTVEQESMTSPESTSSRPSSPSTAPRRERRESAPRYNDLPSPPTRPAPAVPRPSYSGLGQRYDAAAFAAQEGPSAALRLKKPPGSSADGAHFTGLHNPGSWCYANSTLQVLRLTPGIGDELTRFKVENNWEVPTNVRTGIKSPQLMMHMVANLFQWMFVGCFEAMRASTLMEYARHVHEKTLPRHLKATAFGGNDQQDASEWLQFLFTHMSEETNLRCDVAGHTPSEQKETPLQTGLDFWREYSNYNRSIIDKYFRGVEVTKTTCQNCRNVSLRTAESLIFNLSMDGGGPYTLTDLLKGEAAVEEVEGYWCDKCNSEQSAHKSTHFARLPEVLIVQLVRYGMGAKGLKKNRARVTFDVERQSFEPAFLPPEDRGLRPGDCLPTDDNGFGQQFGYRCYGVVMHDGTSVNVGHYYSYVRDLRGAADEKLWYKCNDSQVTPKPGLDVMEACRMDARKESDPFLLFFKRKR